jgi:hypothetical protein
MGEEDQGGQKYTLSEESEFAAVHVDDKTVTKHDPVALTDDQVRRAEDTEGVKLVPAEQTNEQTTEQTGEEG